MPGLSTFPQPGVTEVRPPQLLFTYSVVGIAVQHSIGRSRAFDRLPKGGNKLLQLPVSSELVLLLQPTSRFLGELDNISSLP